MATAKQQFASPLAPTKVPLTRSVGFFTVTHEIAGEYLKFNIGNRGQKHGKIAQYKRDMLGGSFVLNGETIIFDTDGNLIQGQHRLTACLETKSSFETVVVFGIEPEAKTTLDSGAGRTTADAFQVAGILIDERTSFAQTLAAAAGLVIGYMAGTFGKTSLSRHEALELVEDGQLQKSVKFVLDHSNIKNAIPPSLAALLHYLGCYYGKVPAGRKTITEDFLIKLGTGIGMQAGEPVHRLYMRVQKRQKKARSIELAPIALKALRLTFDREQIKSLLVGDSEALPVFP